MLKADRLVVVVVDGGGCDVVVMHTQTKMLTSLGLDETSVVKVYPV